MATYLVFGDLHGRILPAFALARAWSLATGERVDALLQVGDLGFFPDPSRLDRATAKFAARDELELGAQLVASPSEEADELFAQDNVPDTMWFTAGNHEDFSALDDLSRGMLATPDDFPVDAYDRVRVIRDGHMVTLPGGLRVGAVWGIDAEAPQARRDVPPEARIRPRSATRLSGESMHVLLSHDGPRDVARPDAGSLPLAQLLRTARPQLAFFGHYSDCPVDSLSAFSPTTLVHLRGLTFRKRGRADEGCAGVIRFDGERASYEPVESSFLGSLRREDLVG